MDTWLRMAEITKRFPGVVALDRVTFEVERGEIHALVGENGAGKSTLVKVLTGVYAKDSGQVILDGKEVEISSIAQAFQLGISNVHQELLLVPNVSVAENVFLGQRKPTRLGVLIDWRRIHEQTRALLQRIGVSLRPEVKVSELGTAQRQLVQIAQALSRKATLLVLDEPTSALGGREVRRLFRTLRRINQEGVTIIYISHRLHEVLAIADRVTVLRDGERVGTLKTSEASTETLVQLMVGGRTTSDRPETRQARREARRVLEVRSLTRRGCFQDIDLDLYSGEIVGLAGLAGCGRADFVRSIFGAEPADSGEIMVDGERVDIRSPGDAVSWRVGLVPEERRRDGLVLDLPVRENVTMTILRRIQRLGFIKRKEQARITDDSVRSLRIRVADREQQVRYVSGGNQQKIVLAKWLAIRPKVLLLNDPTKGIDIGAKAEIHELIRRIASEGSAILMISSEMPEMLAICDRILTMYEGRLTGELSREEATPEKVAALCHDVAPSGAQ